MGVLLAAGTDGKFVFGERDHAVTDADINDSYDVVIPRDGVYSVSAEGTLGYGSIGATGHVIVEIQATDIPKSTQILHAPTEATDGFNLSRAGVNLTKGDLITVYCYNWSNVDVQFGSGTTSHLDVTYEAEASTFLLFAPDPG